MYSDNYGSIDFQWSNVSTSDSLWEITFYFPISFNSSYYAGNIIDYQDNKNISEFNPLIFNINEPNISSVRISARRIKTIMSTSLRENGIYGFLFIIGY